MRLRALLRHSAQPVSVLTSLLPPLYSSSSSSYHGATLSSFTSISLHPLPLVAFSIRMPSRTAHSLLEHPRTASQKGKQNENHFVVNILASTQRDTAIRFSRADLYPDPFNPSPSIYPPNPSAKHTNEGAAYTLSREGIPILSGSLGALSCTLVDMLPLDKYFDPGAGDDRNNEQVTDVDSQLFIARVVRVEDVPESKEGDMLPLIYHARTYASVGPLPNPTQT